MNVSRYTGGLELNFVLVASKVALFIAHVYGLALVEYIDFKGTLLP